MGLTRVRDGRPCSGRLRDAEKVAAFHAKDGEPGFAESRDEVRAGYAGSPGHAATMTR